MSVKAATKHNCDLCGQDDPKYLEMVPGAAVCGNCGFVYVVYRRGPAEIAKAWDEVWGDGYTSAWPMVKARLTYVAEWIDQNIGLHGKSIMDIGAGEGEFLRIVDMWYGDDIREPGESNLVGIEPSIVNVEKMQRQGIDAHMGTIESINPDHFRRFDIVTILWTLENCGDCIDFLKRAKSFLKPDGHLVVATGSRILVPFKKPLSAYVGSNPPDLHCFRFSYTSLYGAMAKVQVGVMHQNSWQDGDWMVAAGRPMNPDMPLVVPMDEPDEVLQFFNDWQRMWP